MDNVRQNKRKMDGGKARKQVNGGRESIEAKGKER